MNLPKETVLIVGASPDENRYSNKAQKLLTEYGHKVVLVTPRIGKIYGVKPYKNINEVTEEIDTITMYVSPRLSTPMADDFLRIRPRRVIFNPGTENPELQKSLKENGIEILEACTLVLLRSNQF